MEKLKPIPFYKRFGIRVLLFNAILLLSIIVPTLIIRDMDYKHLLDRIGFHKALFTYCTEQLGTLNKNAWPAAIAKMPEVFYQQRICVFNSDKELIYDSGIMKEYENKYMFRPLLPHPYMDWVKQNHHFDPDVYIANLQYINVKDLDPAKTYQSVRSVFYKEGMDRIILSGKWLLSSDGEGFIFTMSHTLADILIHSRAIKERFLFLYSAVILLGLFLTLLLSRSVTSPLKRLYRYSGEILASKGKEIYFKELPKSGEIGEICRALQSLIREQKKQAENFMRFSSDIVHELKTPLAAIRSGLEVYAESTDKKEKAEIYNRINRRILQMENLMNEIRFIGSIESNTADEPCRNIPAVCEEVLYEFAESAIITEIAPGIETCSLPVSCEKLYRILANLLKNAISFSPAGGSVMLSLSLKEDSLIIRVSDRGPGIPEEVFTQITDRFFTFRPQNEEKHSGLGLAIIVAVLRGCGGSLKYHNRPAGGAEFTCCVPVLSRLCEK